MLAFRIALLSWVVSWALASSARAEDPQSAAYTDAIQLGVTEFEQRNFAEARAHFTRAHALSPSARTLRGLGMAEFELKNYGESTTYLEQALSSTVRPLEGDMRDATENLLRLARGYVTRLALQLTPASASVVVDGVATRLALDGSLLLDVGDHVLEVSAPGHMSERRQIKAHGGDEARLSIGLRPLAGPRDAAGRERKLYRNPWLWTAVGVVVVGAATGTAVGLSSGGARTRQEPVYTGNAGAPALEAP
jgi:hypothetical protein